MTFEPTWPALSTDIKRLCRLCDMTQITSQSVLTSTFQNVSRGALFCDDRHASRRFWSAPWQQISRDKFRLVQSVVDHRHSSPCQNLYNQGSHYLDDLKFQVFSRLYPGISGHFLGQLYALMSQRLQLTWNQEVFLKIRNSRPTTVNGQFPVFQVVWGP